MWYAIARNIWKFAWRIWSGFLLAFLGAFLANLLTVEDPKKTASVKAIIWLISPGLIQRLFLIAIALIIIITISSWVITEIEERRKDSSKKEENNLKWTPLSRQEEGQF